MATQAVSDGLKPKHQRLILLLIAVGVLIAATLLAVWALRNQASYFYVPSDMAASPPEPSQAVRLGGMVEKGSLRTEPDGVTIAFVVGAAVIDALALGLAPGRGRTNLVDRAHPRHPARA